MKLQLINKEEFDKLSRQEKIVAICRDVVARMDADLIKAYSGIFWNHIDEEKGTMTPQEHFNQKACEVCAKGGIFSSWVGNFNKISWSDAVRVDEHTDRMPKELVKVFGEDLLNKIETAFEQTVYPWCLGTKDICKYTYWCDEEDSEDRLREIMNNIIENDGDFVLAKK